ncbi:MAG: metal-sulfur cluster assembly factor [Candidatus Zixiibacteriota bacterium]|nr:MAG: metal-sulfur cluster assembly factor [candidate division Zixibacteria bacterium]
MLSEASVMKALEHVIDPEIGIDVVNLGFIYDVRIEGDHAAVAMTLTMKGCPMHATLKEQAEEAIRQLAGAKSAEVRLVFDPPWHPSMMSAAAKERLGFSEDMLDE